MASAPISTAFVLPTGRPGERARRVLAVIDSVHRAGPLPRIPIDERVGAPGADGRYRFDRRRGEARGIGISRTAPHPELTVLQEIGHFLDHQAFGHRGRFASIRHPELADWRRTAMGSRAWQRIRDARQLAALTGSPIADFEYLLDPTEVLARSYAQYVTLKSGDPTLARQLAAMRLAEPPYHLALWEDDDFGSIVTTIGDLLRQKGWLR